MAKIDTVYDISDRALGELKAWLEPWFKGDGGGDCCDPSIDLGSFAGYVTSLGDLIGYWRLGEGAEPWLDTSTAPYGDAHLSKTVRTAHMDDDVVGALSAAQDDGAVEFTGSAFTAGDYLTPAVTGRFQFVSSAYTVACWVKLNSDSGAGSSSMIAGTFSPSNGGWQLSAFGGPTIGHSRISVGVSSTGAFGPAVTLGEWVYIVATWDPSTGHQVFYNGLLVATDPGTTVVPSLTMHVGSMATGGPVYGAVDGAVDELAIWGRVLTADEISGLYARGDPPAAALDGTVLTSDGIGSTSYAFPTVKVAGARYSEILIGPGLTVTDNGDGTVTIDV